MNTVRKAHRILSIIVLAYVLMATISGSIHIVMSNFFSPPPPPQPAPLPRTAGTLVDLGQVLARLGPDAQLMSANLREMGNHLVFQVLIKGEPGRYFDATTGEQLAASADEDYARQIAARHLNVAADTLSPRGYLTQFDHEYLNIFRVLPVHHFEHPQTKQRVYVSTSTGSVTLYTNPARAFAQKSFSTLHKLSFIHPHWLRDTIQALLLAGLASTSLLGAWMFAQRLRRARKPLEKH